MSSYSPRSIVFALAASLTCAALPLAAQTAAPAQSQPSQSQASDTYKLNVQVKRVILDVVVTDSSGKPAEGLKQDDFKVLEDNAPQPLRSFDVHTASASGTAQPPLDLHLPANTFSNLTLAPPDRPVTILLYDALNTPADYLHYAHSELVKFIKDQQSSTRIAIFILTDRLHMLQGFTDNETRLLAAIDDKALKSHTSQLRVADTGADEAALLADPPVPSSVPATALPPDPSAEDEVLQMLQFAEGEEQDFQDLDRIQITVQAFINLARFASSLPGRKNVVWMAGAFPMEIWPGRLAAGTAGSPLGGAASAANSSTTSSATPANNIAAPLDNLLREAQSLLKDSRIAIYPVDIRGLRANPLYRAESGPPPPPPTGSRYKAAPPPPPSFGEKDTGEHAIMDAIADESGGHAFYGTNGLKQAMDTAVRQGSEYYSLTYAPTNPKEDGGERRIKVVLDKPGYRLAYRERYIAPDAAHPAPVRPLVQDMNMQHGAPDSSELFFEAKVFPVGGVMPASPAEIESMKPFAETNARIHKTRLDTSALTVSQTVQHYGIDLAIIGRALQMPPAANGKHSTDLSIGLAAYTQDGELLNGSEISVKSAISQVQFEKIQSQGYHASMGFTVPKEATSLRIGVRDEIGNRIGTMEIPLPLSPLTGTPSTSAPAK